MWAAPERRSCAASSGSSRRSCATSKPPVRARLSACSGLPLTAGPAPAPFSNSFLLLSPGRAVAGGRRRCSGFCFFRGVGGDSGGLPIWSGRSVMFRFVRICSGLFRFVRGVSEELTVASFWQALSTFVNLASTSVKVWQPLSRLGLTVRSVGRRRCGERGMVRHSCSGASVAGVGGSGVCAVVPACAGMTEGAQE